jgi:hypothetical protein
MALSKEEIDNILMEKNPKNSKELMDLFNGVSLNLAYPVFNTYFHSDSFYDYLHKDIKPITFTNFKAKMDFYYYPLEGNIIIEYDTLSNL